MKITDIEIHEVQLPLHDINDGAYRLHLGEGFDTRTIVVLHTDDGLEGVGEVSGRLDGTMQASLEQMRGTNPCTWLAHPQLFIGLAPAIYDLVGKAMDVPAYHLFGPAVRAQVPVSYWTVSQTPAKMAVEVERAAAMGYTWMKYHTDSLHNIVAQTQAMQAVAPEGFRLHYDVNMDNTVEHVLHLARRLVEYPVAGLIEDPLRTHDFEGLKLLRQKCPLPIIFHHLPLHGREALMGLADGYMLGHSPVGQVVRAAGAFEAANTPFMTQNVGGSITRALIVHMAAAHEMATLHHVTCTHLWTDDVVKHDMVVRGGTISVPQAPGLGVTLARERLQRYAAAPAPPLPRALIHVRHESGYEAFARAPRGRRDGLHLDVRDLPGMGEGYDHPVDTDYWLDDGSERFARLWEATAAGHVIEEASP